MIKEGGKKKAKHIFFSSHYQTIAAVSAMAKSSTKRFSQPVNVYSVLLLFFSLLKEKKVNNRAPYWVYTLQLPWQGLHTASGHTAESLYVHVGVFL